MVAEILEVPAWLKAEIVPLAWLWTLRRKDGVVLGFTSHDRDMERGGLTYRAAPGMVPSAISLSASLEADTMDIDGALSNAAITAVDLDAGRWDGAEILLHAANWEDAGDALILIASGTLGTVERKRGAFSAELKTAAHRLDASVVPATSPDCRAMLGDKDCRVDTGPLTKLVRLASGEGRMVEVETVLSAEGYGFGSLRLLCGNNCGLHFPVRAQDGQRLTLARDLPEPVAAGMLAEIIQGCDKRLTTCRTRFANAINFRGEPYLPGIDYVTRYPGA